MKHGAPRSTASKCICCGSTNSIENVKPRCVIVDPITNLTSGSSDKEVYSMLLRLVDLLKSLENYRSVCEPYVAAARIWKTRTWGFRPLPIPGSCCGISN